MSTLYLDIIFIVILAFLRSRSWNWWSHPWNLWVSLARIRLYCRILWFYPLLSVPQPIPQCATRFESFTIWWLLRPDFFFPPRFRRSCLTIWPILQISWPWFGASKRLHRISSSRRRQNSNQSNRSTDSYVCIITQKNFSSLIQHPLLSSTRDNVNVKMYGSLSFPLLFSISISRFAP